MTKKDTDLAYTAIKKYVHQYALNHDVVGLEQELLEACNEYFKKHMGDYDAERKASVQTFAVKTANTCLFTKLRAMARQKRCEKIANFRAGLDRGEVLEQKKIAALVHEALRQLPHNQVEILLWIQEGKDLQDLATKKGIPERTFRRRVHAAKQAFVDVYQKLINED